MQKSNCISNLNLFMFVSPTLDCSIEMLRYICRYVCRYVGMLVCWYVGLSTKNMYAKMHGQNYMVQIHACSSKFRVVKQTCDMRSIHFDYTIELL